MTASIQSKFYNGPTSYQKNLLGANEIAPRVRFYSARIWVAFQLSDARKSLY
jgi:hypothetical protein